jgi:hypothetical protein
MSFSISPFQLAIGCLLLLTPLCPAKKKTDDKPQTKDKIASSGKILGVLKEVDKSATAFTLTVTYYEPDPNKVRDLYNYQAQKKLEIARTRNPVDRARIIQDYNVTLQKKMIDAYTKHTKDVKLEATDAMKVRRKKLPIDYDDKGKIKKYTAKEKRALKGPNKRLPGYTAEPNDLSKGQTVVVYLAKKPKKGRKKGKGKETDELFTKLPKVVMILIVTEPKTQQ